MSNLQTAMTFSMSQEVKKEINRIAKQEQRSKSAIFRDMYQTYMFGRALDNIQASSRATAIKFGIETDDDVVEYLNNNVKFAKYREPKA